MEYAYNKFQLTDKERKMIVLNVTYKCKPEMREEFLEMIMTEGRDEALRMN